jgi:transcriptional regulator with GAF, ATPase, and Fis domain
VGTLQDPFVDWKVSAIATKGIDAFREILLTALRDLESIEADSQPSVLKFRLRDEVRRFEIDLICAALQKTNGNQRHAAMLGTNATTLQSTIKRYKITISRSHLDNVITE